MPAGDEQTRWRDNPSPARFIGPAEARRLGKLATTTRHSSDHDDRTGLLRTFIGKGRHYVGYITLKALTRPYRAQPSSAVLILHCQYRVFRLILDPELPYPGHLQNSLKSAQSAVFPCKHAIHGTGKNEYSLENFFSQDQEITQNFGKPRNALQGSSG